MVAIVRMRMIMNTARLIVEQMSRHYENHRERQKPVLEVVKQLFCYEETDACSKYDQRSKIVVVLTVAVNQRIGAYAKSQEYHEIFKCHVVYQVDTQNGQRPQQQRQNGAMNCTRYRSYNTSSIPVDPCHDANIDNKPIVMQHSCKNQVNKLMLF